MTWTNEHAERLRAWINEGLHGIDVSAALAEIERQAEEIERLRGLEDALRTLGGFEEHDLFSSRDHAVWSSASSFTPMPPHIATLPRCRRCEAKERVAALSAAPSREQEHGDLVSSEVKAQGVGLHRAPVQQTSGPALPDEGVTPRNAGDSGVARSGPSRGITGHQGARPEPSQPPQRRAEGRWIECGVDFYDADFRCSLCGFLAGPWAIVARAVHEHECWRAEPERGDTDATWKGLLTPPTTVQNFAAPPQPDALKPCPFCGADSFSQCHVPVGRRMAWRCCKCLAQGPAVERDGSDAPLMDAWNARHGDDPLLAEILKAVREPRKPGEYSIRLADAIAALHKREKGRVSP